MQRIDPMSLRLFVRVVEEGTIAAAAEREHIVAAAISKRLAEIESALGTPVLLRTNKGVEPTAAGVALMSLARRALYELEQIPIQMKAYSSGLRGTVRICASTSALTQFLPGDIASFLERHNDVQVQLEEKTSTAVARSVVENAADIGIFASALDDERLTMHPYRQDELVLCTPREHPLAGKQAVAFVEVMDETFVGMKVGSAIDLLLARAAGLQGRSLRVCMYASSFDSLCVMIDAGLGVGVMPKAVARRGAASLDLSVIPLTEAWSHRAFRIGVRREAPPPAAAASLLQHLCAQAALAAKNPVTP